jgi:hypothetical protein
MSMLADLNTLLEKIPVWRDLVTLPKRVAAIEARLNMAAAPAIDDRPVCQFCRKGRMDLTEEVPDPTFGPLGVMKHTLKCAEWGKTTSRQREP